MTTFANPCDDARLRLLLTAPEGSAEFRAAAEHLDRCETCQTRITQLAAEIKEWDETRQLLSANEQDLEFDRECRDRSWSKAATLSIGSGYAETTQWTAALTSQYLSPPSHPEMLGRLGRYEIERLIGSGGMGIVMKGFDTELNRPVAIKMLAPHLAGSGAARQRFAREARAAAAVVHEHVVAIHDVQSECPMPYLVMQFVSGESLQARLDRQGPLEICELLRIARQTAAGLAAAHAQGLVHRDVKPSNILLERGIERALLTDFGLARASDDASLTHTGHLPGTPHYMSPEQARGDAVDGRSDLFSLGSVMYAMATGRPPFRADSSLGVLRRITDCDPRPIREINPAVSGWLALLILRLHAKLPKDRFESAAQVAAVLEGCLAHLQQPTAVPLPEECRAEPSPSSLLRRLALAGGIAACIVFVILAVQSANGNRPGNSPSPATASSPATRPTNPRSSDIDPATDWFEVERGIGDLRREFDAVESRVRKLWNDAQRAEEREPAK